MGLITNNLTIDLIAIAATLIVGIISYIKYKHTYFARKGFYTPEPQFFIGNAKKVLTKQQTFGLLWNDIYNELKQKKKHGGGYFITTPMYLPTDLDIVKSILQNDFQHFIGHGSYVNEEGDPLSAHLFNLSGEKWKNLRGKLTPTFTSGKMKMMFSTLAACSEGLKEMLEEAAAKKSPLDIKDILQRFTIDIIGSCAFGIETNCMKNPDSEFAKKGKDIFNLDYLFFLKILMQLVVPHSILLKMNFSSQKNHITEFFTNLTKDTVEYREKNNVYRKDFMHLLIQLKNRGLVADDEKLVDENGKPTKEFMNLKELSAQVFVFFVAGFETSSTTMTFALFELAQRPDLQKKVRKEIDEVLARHDNLITYDAIKELKYLDQVVDETLRMHPPVPFLNRECNKKYTIPGTKLVLDEGDSVVISSYAIHHDPEIYPDPETFDPERFSDENKAKRHQFAWLPFGAGPRACIGLRFGVMQAKVGLTTILRDYDISLNEKTKTPITYDPSSFILAVDEGVWINVTRKQN